MIVASALVAAVPTVAAHADSSSPSPDDRSALSTSQWAGYLADGGPYQEVTAGWVQPEVRCTAPDAGLSVWVGLNRSDIVEQVGTAADCSGGVPHYYAWYEMFPQPTVVFDFAEVQPGDRMTATATLADAHTYVLVVHDETRNWTWRGQEPATGEALRAQSAEVLVEAHGVPAQPLADFGKVDFTDAAIDGRDLRSAAPVRYVMAGGGDYNASTGSIDTAGKAFTVTWG